MSAFGVPAVGNRTSLFLGPTRTLLVEFALHLVACALLVCFVDGGRSRFGSALARMGGEPLLVSGFALENPLEETHVATPSAY